MRKLILLILSFNSVAFADLHTELNNFFERFGSQSNVSSASIYEGQKAGYLTGGGMAIRNRIVNQSPMTVNLPSIDAGCGGIDLYAGGFSFINSDQLISSLKNVGSSATGYAFLLGLETVSPQVANTIKNLQTWANNINSFNINSCEMAAGLVGSVWPRQTQASQHICKTLGGKKGLFDDYLSARHNCSQSSERDNFRKRISEDKDYQDFLFEDYNIAWRVIQKQPFLAKDTETAELFMALMGTVIFTQKGNEPYIDPIDSKIYDESFLKSLLEGGELNLYTCQGSSDCLKVCEKQIYLPPEKSWMGKIRQQMLSIQNKILTDEELSKEEKSLLEKTNLPIYKVLNVLTAFHHGDCAVNIYEISHIVALDLLTQFLKESIQLVRETCYQLRQAQMYSDKLDEYLVNLERVENQVHYYEVRSAKLLEEEFQLMQKVQLIEKQIASELILR